VGLLQLAPRIDTPERATEEALFHRSPKRKPSSAFRPFDGSNERAPSSAE
jgi:hypothetical protein